MPIDTSKEPEFVYRFSRRWTIAGHEVALGRMMYLKRKGDRWSDEYLFCECDFDFVIEVGENGRKSKLMKSDAFKCPARAKVRRMAVRDSRRLHGESWEKMGVKEAILDIHRRVKKGEWLGQRDPTMIYAQEVAEILDEEMPLIWAACGELYKEEKLDLNGAILADYKGRFRLPSEMAAVIFHVVGDPLGYPNGDAGDGAIWQCEARIQKTLGVKSGKKAFGENNWPSIDAEIVASNVFDPLAGMLAAAVALPNAREQLRRQTRRAFMKDMTALAEEHPEIRLDVMAEYMRELVRLAFDRSLLYAAMSWPANKKEIDAAKRSLGKARKAYQKLSSKDGVTPEEIIAFARRLPDSSKRLKAVKDRILATEKESLKEMSRELVGWSDALRKRQEQKPR